MKRKHDESVDLNELRRRAGELVARAGLENGEVKDCKEIERNGKKWKEGLLGEECGLKILKIS